VASGNDVTVYLDGAKLKTVPAAGLTTGSVGFANAAGAVARVKDLSVVSSAGRTLYQSAMTSPDVLGDFSAGTNPMPVIIDGGKRDRLVWGGDLLQAAPTVYYTSQSAAEVRGSLALFASYRTPQGEISSDLPVASALGTRPVTALPGLGGFFSLSYSEDWLLALYQYYWYTGDEAFIRQVWPAVEAELGYLKANTDGNGLVVTNASDGMDWAIDTQTGTATAYNALYYEGLASMAKLASTLGQTAEATMWAQRAATVKRSVNAVLFDAKTGVYDASSDARGTYAQDANSLAVLFGIAPEGKAASIMTKLNARLATKNGPQSFSDGTGLTAVISPFMSAFDADAAFSTGQAGAALGVIREVWGHMVKGQPFYSGGDFEALGLDGAPQSDTRTLAHAWSTGATSALSEYILGVQPAAPGYSRYLIEPQTSSLAWAKGTVPTPCGTIAVFWTRHASGLRLTLTVPSGETGTVVLPRATGSQLTIQGGQLPPATVTAGAFRITITAGGTYTFTVSS
jgi:alpha-L-rhamnosidase